MTVTTDVPSVAGISAAELAAMRDAADVFREQFTGGRGQYVYASAGPGQHDHRWGTAAHLFGALAEPFSPPPAPKREEYKAIGSGHWCV